MPSFVQSSDVISPSELYIKFTSGNARRLVCVHFLAALNVHLERNKMISKNAMSEFFHNLSMQALSKSDDAILIKFDAISNKLNNSLNDLLTGEALAFETKRVSRMMIFFDQPVFVSAEQTDNNRIEKDIVINILNDEEIDFPTDTGHISLSNTAEEIKQQSIDENKLLLETELKKMKETLKR